MAAYCNTILLVMEETLCKYVARPYSNMVCRQVGQPSQPLHMHIEPAAKNKVWRANSSSLHTCFRRRRSAAAQSPPPLPKHQQSCRAHAARVYNSNDYERECEAFWARANA